MDMSKAFDMVSWKELFTTLVNRGIKPIFLRLLVYIYTNQEYTVKWGDSLANYFNISNGVRQGGRGRQSFINARQSRGNNF